MHRYVHIHTHTHTLQHAHMHTLFNMHTNYPCLLSYYSCILAFQIWTMSDSSSQWDYHIQSVGKLTAQYRAFKITFSTTKVKLFTTAVHIKQRTKLKFTASYGYLMWLLRTWPELHACMHTYATLAIWAIIDNLQSVESTSTLDIFSMRPGLLYWRSLCGHLCRQIHYGANRVVRNVYRNIERWVVYVQNAPFLEKLWTEAWSPVYNFWQ